MHCVGCRFNKDATNLLMSSCNLVCPTTSLLGARIAHVITKSSDVEDRSTCPANGHGAKAQILEMGCTESTVVSGSRSGTWCGSWWSSLGLLELA